VPVATVPPVPGRFERRRTSETRQNVTEPVAGSVTEPITDASPQRLLVAAYASRSSRTACWGRVSGDGTQQGEAPTLAVHGVLPRRKRNVPAAGAAALPDREANQLEAARGPG